MYKCYFASSVHYYPRKILERAYILFTTNVTLSFSWSLDQATSDIIIFTFLKASYLSEKEIRGKKSCLSMLKLIVLVYFLIFNHLMKYMIHINLTANFMFNISNWTSININYKEEMNKIFQFTLIQLQFKVYIK